MGLFSRIGGGLAKIFKPVRKVIKKGIDVGGKVFDQADKIMNSPVGQVVMGLIKSNPKTAKIGQALETGISSGKNISDVARDMSSGDQAKMIKAITRVGENVQRGGNITTL